MRLAAQSRIFLLAATGFLVLILFQAFFISGIDPRFWLVVLAFLALSVHATRTGQHALLYYALFMLYSPFLGDLIQQAIGVSYLNWSFSSRPLDMQATILLLVHVAGLFLGSLFSPMRRASAVPLRPRGSQAILAVSMVAIVLVGSIGVVGADQFFTPRNHDLASQGPERGAVVAFVELMLKFLPFVGLVALLHNAFVSGRRSRLLIAVLAVFTLAVSNPVTTSRFISMTGVSLVVIFVLLRRYRPSGISNLIHVLPFIFILVLPVTSLMRNGLTEVTFTSFIGIFSSLEFSVVQMIIAGASADLPDSGTYVLSGLLVFAPRFLWPGKADGLGVAVAEEGGFVFLNSAIPSFFAGYADAGYLGAAVFSLFIGWVLGWARLSNGMQWSDRADFYKIIVFVSVPIIARGDFSTCMISIYALVAAYEVMRFLGRFRLGSPGSER